MAAAITLSDLITALPRGDEFTSKKLPPGLRYVAERNPLFVEPRLVPQRAVEPRKTAVIVVAAPGAVGKSTLAAEVAVRTSSVIWDLSKMNVGSKTFSGTVLDGWDAHAHGILKRIEDGRFLFVLDALDEAQVRAGRQNFDAFLSDLAEKVGKDNHDRPSLVLLARTDTADDVELQLEEGGVAYARYQVEYFDQGQALEFIDKRLDGERAKDSKVPVHRQQAKAFTEVRDYLFELIYTLFDVKPAKAWDDQRVRDFLGYAPVLEALTEYLDVSNPKKLFQELKDEKGHAKDPWQFLTTIIFRLQGREQGKIQDDLVKPVLETMPAAKGWKGASKLYDADEQCARVLRYSLRLPSALGAAADMPAPVSDRYEEGLATALPTHPFLTGRNFTNIVFKEFTYAWGIARADATAQASLRTIMRKREEPFLPSPLFSRFVANIEETIDAQDFGIVYESLLARSRRVEISLLESEDTIDAQVLLADEERALTFTLLDTGHGVHFWWRLNNADVDVSRAVRLGFPEQKFALGPAVDITCGEFSVQCEQLDADPTGNIWIRATSNVSTGNLRLRVRESEPPGGRLAVVWPEIAHPWVSYRATDTIARAVLTQDPRGDALRKFLLMFRRQRSRKKDTVKNARWSPEQLTHRDALLRLATDRKVLTEGKNGSYEFNSDYDSLKSLIEVQPKLSPKARDFVTAYLGDAMLQRLIASL